MDRVPEPELMLGVEQALAYAYADFAEPHSRFVTLLKERFPNLPSSGRVLDLGSGPGDISCRLARAFPAWKIDAVDGSPAMLELGRRRVVEAGLTSRVQFHELILPVDKLPHDSYVLVFSNSLLHHLRDPMVLWSTVHRQQPATDVFVMDLLRPSSRSETDALVDQYAKDEPEILQTDFFNSLLAAYETVEVESQLKSVDLGHLNLEVVSDRHFIVWGRIGGDKPAAQ